MVKKILVSFVVIAIAIGAMEFKERVALKEESFNIDQQPLEVYIERLLSSKLSTREAENRYIIHNTALFSQYPFPENITSAFIGTSRTKILKPSLMGLDQFVNAAGNSYNEITYGMLVQAEILKYQFPQLKNLYIEASLLLRRPPPPHFDLDPSHKKYIPVIRRFFELRNKLPSGDAFKKFYLNQAGPGTAPINTSLFFANRANYKLASIFGLNSKKDLFVFDNEKILGKLKKNGEKKHRLTLVNKNPAIGQKLNRNHPKISRLIDIPSWYPWDMRFEMIALWGIKNNVNITFYEPPVRSDFFKYQLLFDLKKHQKKLESIANKYGFPYINLNRPSMGYGEHAEIFSDEDHLGTCTGSLLLLNAIVSGQEKHVRGEDRPTLTYDDNTLKIQRYIQNCGA